MDKELKLKLKKLAQQLKPVVIIGQKGLTEAVINEADVALKAHECIKIKISGWEKQDKTTMVNTICQQNKAEFIHSVGNMFIVFRKKDA
ncbi:MAG: YhbY family RNA-binding protein [Chryseobacterium sp.]